MSMAMPVSELSGLQTNLLKDSEGADIIAEKSDTSSDASERFAGLEKAEGAAISAGLPGAAQVF